MNLSNLIGGAIALAILAHAAVLALADSPRGARYELQSPGSGAFALVLDKATGEVWRHNVLEPRPIHESARIAAPAAEVRREAAVIEEFLRLKREFKAQEEQSEPQRRSEAPSGYEFVDEEELVPGGDEPGSTSERASD